jgi:ABC-type multidrug transport system fused ATPase/permease subunit
MGRSAGGSVNAAATTAGELRRLGSGGRDDRLRFRLVIRILLRCLPLLRGVRRHLLGFAGVTVGLFAVFLPLAAMAFDVFWTGVLQGQPLPAIQARLLWLDPALSVDVDALSAAARRGIRDHLFVGSLVVIVGVALPAAGGLYYYYVWITQRINQELRLQLHDRLQALSLRFHAEHRVGDALYRLYQDSAMVSDLIEALFLTPLMSFGRYLIAAAVIAVFDPVVALVYVLMWPPGLAIGYWMSRRLRVGFRAAREANAALTSRIQEIIAGIKVVKAYGVEPSEQRSFETHSRAAFRAAFGVRFLVCVFSVLAFVLASMALLGATARSLELTRAGDPVFATALLAVFGFRSWTLGAFNVLKGEMAWGSANFRMIYRMWARVQDMAIGLDRVFELLDLEPEVRDAPDAIDLPPFRGEVAFRGVSFRYQPDRPALEDVSFEARAGSVTAVVGPTGSGKSTLMSLLLRLFDPDAGSVEIDGHDLRRLRLASLRNRVSIALQENLLFGSSVRENIRYAVPDASDARVREAARVACADEFIEKLPDGYDTLLGERGTKLSSGQRQRLSIARALLKDTPILILDEPTASLDAETELRLLRNLAEWGRDRVIFLITHRLSTIRRADRIAVLRDGRLVESGSHEELVARDDGAYRWLVEQEEDAQPQRVAKP